MLSGVVKICVLSFCLLMAAPIWACSKCHSAADGGCEAGCTCCGGHHSSTSTPPVVNAADLPPPEEGVVDIAMVDYQFVPFDVTVTPGTTIRWTNLDNDIHDTVEQNHNMWNSFSMQAGGIFTYDVPDDALGDIPYTCTLHAGMEGVITVVVPEPGTLGLIALAPFCIRRRRIG